MRCLLTECVMLRRVALRCNSAELIAVRREHFAAKGEFRGSSWNCASRGKL